MPRAFFCLAASTFAQVRTYTELINDSRQELITPEIDTRISGLLKEWNSGLSMAVVKQHDEGEWVVETGVGPELGRRGRESDSRSSQLESWRYGKFRDRD